MIMYNYVNDYAKGKSSLYNSQHANEIHKDMHIYIIYMIMYNYVNDYAKG